MTTRVREDPALAAAAPPLESGMDHAATASLLSTLWDDSVLPALSEFIAVESQSPLFDPEWETNGLLDKSVAILVEWVRAQKVEGLTVEVRPPPLTPHPTPPLLPLLLASPQPAAPRRQVVSAPGLTPVIFIEVAPSTGGAAAGTVLLYGHADTQPPFVGWSDGLSPYKPTLRDGKLYGRGACDDGYSIFAAVTAIMALKAQVPYPLPPTALAVPCHSS